MEEPMSTTLTIPADIVPDVREGVLSLMGDATEQIDRAVIRPGRELHPEWFEQGRRQLEQVFALLDLVGWASDSAPHPITLDLREHGLTLKEAAEHHVSFLTDRGREPAGTDRRHEESSQRQRNQEIARRAAALRALVTMVAQRIAEDG
jgi:hypothetical protein